MQNICTIIQILYYLFMKEKLRLYIQYIHCWTYGYRNLYGKLAYLLMHTYGIYASICVSKTNGLLKNIVTKS